MVITVMTTRATIMPETMPTMNAGSLEPSPAQSRTYQTSTCSVLYYTKYRIAGYFRKVFIFGYFERAYLFENKFPGQAVLRK